MASILRKNRKADPGADNTARPAVFTFSDMGAQGDEYVTRVRSEAAKIVQQANAKAESIRERARVAGEKSAHESIEQLLDQRLGEHLETLRPALDGVVARLDATHDEWIDHWEQSALGLAVAIAERIVRRELKHDPELPIGWLREALDLAAGTSEVIVRLNPSDLQKLRGQIDTLLAGLGRLGETQLRADESVSPGGCLVETKHGVIDHRLETQLARLETELE